MGGLRRSRKGCITDAIEKAYATWFTGPNQARTSVIPGGREFRDCVKVLLAWFDIGEGDVEPGKFHLVLGEVELAWVQGDPVLGTHVQPLGGLMERCLDVSGPKQSIIDTFCFAWNVGHKGVIPGSICIA